MAFELGLQHWGGRGGEDISEEGKAQEWLRLAASCGKEAGLGGPECQAKANPRVQGHLVTAAQKMGMEWNLNLDDSRESLKVLDKGWVVTG